MSQIQRKKVNNLKLRARTPAYFRALALAALAVTIAAIGIGFYQNSGTKDFRMKGMPTELSKDIVAVVNGFERREVEGDVVKYYIKADKATTFSDNHQELENVYLEVYNPENENPDKITANRAVYIPTENKSFNAYFMGAVNIDTRDGLNVKSEQIGYDKASEIAESEELVEFARENISGKSIGARVFVKDKRLELLNQVEINAFSDETAQNNELARANLAAGAYVNADSELDRCIKRKGEALSLFVDEDPTFAYFPAVYYYQGRIREALKNVGFTESYKQYLAIRGQSTEDPLVVDVRRRIKE